MDAGHDRAVARERHRVAGLVDLFLPVEIAAALGPGPAAPVEDADAVRPPFAIGLTAQAPEQMRLEPVTR